MHTFWEDDPDSNQDFTNITLKYVKLQDFSVFGDFMLLSQQLILKQ